MKNFIRYLKDNRVLASGFQIILCSIIRQFRQITKNKPSFTNDDSLRKMLYLASRKIVGHWTSRCRNWDMVLAQLQLMFQDRLIPAVPHTALPLVGSSVLDCRLSAFIPLFIDGVIPDLLCEVAHLFCNRAATDCLCSEFVQADDICRSVAGLLLLDAGKDTNHSNQNKDTSGYDNGGDGCSEMEYGLLDE